MKKKNGNKEIRCEQQNLRCSTVGWAINKTNWDLISLRIKIEKYIQCFCFLPFVNRDIYSLSFKIRRLDFINEFVCY